MAINDDFGGQRLMNGPAERMAAVTPSDNVDLPFLPLALYVGGAGDVTVVTKAGDTVTFKAVPVGTILPVRPLRVKATGTDASFIVACG